MILDSRVGVVSDVDHLKYRHFGPATSINEVNVLERTSLSYPYSRIYL